ncbi:hypothetical protein U2A4042180016 [Corynebacterium striatum]|nr:hypothetical protein U2A4042180016 [Corynebacterium striatum]
MSQVRFYARLVVSGVHDGTRLMLGELGADRSLPGVILSVEEAQSMVSFKMNKTNRV